MNRPPCFHGNSLPPDRRQTCCLKTRTRADGPTDRRSERSSPSSGCVFCFFFKFQLCSISLYLNLEIFDLPFRAEQRGEDWSWWKRKRRCFLPLSQRFCQRGAAVPDGTFQVHPSTFSPSLRMIMTMMMIIAMKRKCRRKRGRRRKRKAPRVLASILECAARVGVFAVRQ